MPARIRKARGALLFLAAALYPALVYFFVAVRGVPLRQFSLFLIAFAAFALIAGAPWSGAQKSGAQKSGGPRASGKGAAAPPLGKGLAGRLPGPLLPLAVGIAALATDSATALRLYPLLVNALLLAAFAGTLLSPPSMAFRLATMQDKTIRGSLGEKKVGAYCRKVTIAWCAFFVANGSVAAWTIFFGSDAQWSVYNGGISYILIGALFAGEFAVRKMAQRKIPKAVPLSALNSDSRDASAVVCFDGSWGDGRRETWGDFLRGTAALRRRIDEAGGGRWFLRCDDGWHFLLALAALLQCRKEVALTASAGPALARERDGAPMLADVPAGLPGGEIEIENSENVFNIPAILAAAGAAGSLEKAPEISAEEAAIVLHTSGSAGEPKEVRWRLAELESDNKFALAKWGDEFLGRKFCSTVSHHHIYGLLYSALLPFTAGVPFRRGRISFPEELEKLRDAEYALITVPAFLKRAAEAQSAGGPLLKSPWIISSGGALDPETAQKTRDALGFWPVEVYGSTETAGVAWRQSSAGAEWTPFDGAQATAGREGRLVVRSPCVMDPAGFETADLAEILEDGRFLLKGRADLVVKIEEKRVCLAEVESRVMQSGLAADACAVAMEGKRQYLAAAVAFNDKGKERFAGLEKKDVNEFWRRHLSQYFESVVVPKKWRYLDALPADSQGKKKRGEVRLLFEVETSNKETRDCARGFGSLGAEKVIEKTENSVSLEFSVPATSPYFDGHFPGLPVLPGVAQIELVMRFAARHLEASVALSGIRRVKFTNFVRPDAPLLLKLEKNGKTITFSLSSRDGEKMYSMGTMGAIAPKPE